MNHTIFVALALLLTSPLLASAQNQTSDPQQSTEGIEKRSNEFGVWGSISFDATTWIGYTPDASPNPMNTTHGSGWIVQILSTKRGCHPLLRAPRTKLNS
jgi:hypothetical protein